MHRDQSGYEFAQWEKALHSNASSHWLNHTPNFPRVTTSRRTSATWKYVHIGVTVKSIHQIPPTIETWDFQSCREAIYKIPDQSWIT